MAVRVTLLVCLVAVVGCASSSGTPAASRLTPAGTRFAIAYSRDGGLAPSLRSLRVRPGRSAIVTGSGAGDYSGRLLTSWFRIGKVQVKRLRRALARARFRGIEAPAPGSPDCADCYLYKIRYRGHRVALTETQVPNRLRPVIDRIETLIEAHLPFH
jgi:hypothetical protein